MENVHKPPFWKNKKYWPLFAIGVFVIISIGVFALNMNKDTNTQDNSQQPPQEDPLPPLVPPDDYLAIYNSDNPNFKFQRFPFDLQDVGSVAPIGEFAGIKRETVTDSHFYGNMRHYVFSKNQV